MPSQREGRAELYTEDAARAPELVQAVRDLMQKDVAALQRRMACCWIKRVAVYVVTSARGLLVGERPRTKKRKVQRIYFTFGGCIRPSPLPMMLNSLRLELPDSLSLVPSSGSSFLASDGAGRRVAAGGLRGCIGAGCWTLVARGCARAAEEMGAAFGGS